MNSTIEVNVPAHEVKNPAPVFTALIAEAYVWLQAVLRPDSRA